MATAGEPFANFDLSGFWRPSDRATQKYVGAPLNPEGIASVEGELGYRLPRAYIALAQTQNGGFPNNTYHPAKRSGSRGTNYVSINGIFSIGAAKRYSLCGTAGSAFWIDEWEYPPIGIYFADCPSGGHDLLCLDYRECGPEGEPKVVHVDESRDFEITFVAENFELFIRGLQPSEAFAS